MMKKATWYGHETMSPFRVYCWYYTELSGKKREEILLYPVEPDTIGEVAQANTLGISIRELHTLKKWLSEVKSAEWNANMPHITEALLNVCIT